MWYVGFFDIPQLQKNMKRNYSIIQYSCAVLLIISSIALVSYQVIEIKDVANGLLLYVAQAFLLAGSIFGLDYYVRQINIKLNEHFKYEKKNYKRD